MLHILDTSVIVSIIRGHAPAHALPDLDTCIVSVISAAELEVGVRKSARPLDQRMAVSRVLAPFRIVPLETPAVAHYGEIRAELEKKGAVIGPLDLLIAAHARSLGAALVTGNVGEFRRVTGLKVIAWK